MTMSLQKEGIWTQTHTGRQLHEDESSNRVTHQQTKKLEDYQQITRSEERSVEQIVPLAQRRA